MIYTFFLVINGTKYTTYINRFLLQICQVNFSDFTKPISTDTLGCTGIKILTKKAVATAKFAMSNGQHPLTVNDYKKSIMSYCK